MNKNKIIGLLILLLHIPNSFFIYWLFMNLDYCVVYCCGLTHAYSAQDAIWDFYPLPSAILICLVSLYFIAFRDRCEKD